MKLIYLNLVLSSVLFLLFLFIVNEIHAKLITFIYSIYLFFYIIYISTYFNFSVKFFMGYTIVFSELFNLKFLIGIDIYSLIFLFLITFMFPLIILTS